MTAKLLATHHDHVVAERVLAAALAAIVVIDAISVGAPGLALLAVPFVVIALRFHDVAHWSAVVVLAACALFAALGVNYAIAHGFDAPAGDLLFAYGGTLVSAALGFTVVHDWNRDRQ